MVALDHRAAMKAVVLILLLSSGTIGCAHRQAVVPAPDSVPRELTKVTLPEYVIEPPDILQIDALQIIPKAPYRIKSLDALTVRTPGALPTEPIAAVYQVDPEGNLDLGGSYGRIKVVGLTIDQARAEIEKRLATVIKEPRTDVTLAETRAGQQIRGPHLVRPDGSISLGQYGSVPVTGLTLAAAKARIEAHLGQYLQDPEVNVDVAAYNSKVYYVIFDQGGSGQQVVRLPVTGNETVLDAIGQVNGLTPVSDQQRIWISRPGSDGCESILPVDWDGLTACGKTSTNYQLMPGDRLFVKAYPMVALDTALARALAPVERIFGVTLLGVGTVRTIQNENGGGGGIGGGFGGF